MGQFARYKLRTVNRRQNLDGKVYKTLTAWKLAVEIIQ